MKKNSKLITNISFLLLPILVVGLCSLLVFTKTDSKINDLFMRALPPLEESDHVLLVNIDDNLIDQTGVWPLTRNIYADMLITMKELGAEAFISDLSFVDNSPMQVNQDYLDNDLPRYVDEDFDELNSNLDYAISALSNAGEENPVSPEEIEAEVLESNEDIKNRLKVSISSASKNYDIDLAHALKFFDNSYLTLWMQSGYDMTKVDMDYLENHLALSNVVSNGDTVTPEYDSVQPAIDLLIKNSASAGFVNADPDSDGYLRRLNLVTKYRGRYYGQLVFVPILHHYGDPQVIVSNSSIILKGAKIAEGVTKDIVIPRGEDGKVIVKFPKKKYVGYNQISSWNIYRIYLQERGLVRNLRAMKDNGYFDAVWDPAEESPVDVYDGVEYVRNALYEGESEEVDFEMYMSELERFYAVAEEFIEGSYERELLEMAEGDSDLIGDILLYFRTCSEQLADLKKSRAETGAVLKDALCVIGTTASSTTDYGLITYQEQYPNVGVHATMANQLLCGEFVDDAPWYMGVIIALVLCYLYVFICFKIKTPGRKLLLGLVILALAIGGLLATFVITKIYLGAAVPTISTGIIFVTMTAISLISTSRDKKFIQEKFGAYVAPEIVDQLVAHPESAKVGGDSKHITALFSDVKTFSGFTETVNNVATKNVMEHNQEVRDGKWPGEEPLSDDEVAMKGAAKGAENLVAYLNDYLGALSDAIMKEHGTIDKYVGDEIVSFFGAPIDDPNHAWNACVAGIRMLQAEAQYNREHEAELPINVKTGKPFLLNSRVGINTGDMVVGNMGTTRKLNYTVMGNNVNLASRLEGTNKAYQSWIMCSESTWKEATATKHDDELIGRRFDCVQVVNVVQPVPIYNILGLRSELPPAQIEAAEIFNKGIEWYLKGSETPDLKKDPEDLKKAYQFFKQALDCFPDDRSSEVFMQRCMFFVQNGLPERWDGVYTMTSK
ncbi:MAG: CHASE2 domain-containing protein [Treponema sp.]|nr:CHASE2 domain-containing protein [Treponema sp.]